ITRSPFVPDATGGACATPRLLPIAQPGRRHFPLADQAMGATGPVRRAGRSTTKTQCLDLSRSANHTCQGLNWSGARTCPTPRSAKDWSAPGRPFPVVRALGGEVVAAY